MFEGKIQFQTHLYFLNLYFNNFLCFQVPESTSEKYFHFSERQKCSKSCPEPQKNYMCWIIHAAAAEPNASQGQTATQIVDFILYSRHPLVCLTSPFFAHVASRCFPLTLNRYFTVNTFSCASTLWRPEAKGFWNCPGFHLFVVIMNRADMCWWNFTLMEQ